MQNFTKTRQKYITMVLSSQYLQSAFGCGATVNLSILPSNGEAE
jgi:hypothetical protein